MSERITATRMGAIDFMIGIPFLLIQSCADGPLSPEINPAGMDNKLARLVRLRLAADHRRLPFGQRQKLPGVHWRHLAVAIDQHDDGSRLQSAFFAFSERAVLVATDVAAPFDVP